MISRKTSSSLSNEEIPHNLWKSEVKTHNVLITEYTRPSRSTGL